MIDIIEHPSTDARRYLDLMSPEAADQLTKLADDFAGVRVLHVNSTANGGGVAEILHSLVPLSNALGITTERAVIVPDDPAFFTVTKRIHNMLQGADGELSAAELDVYYGCLNQVACEIERTGMSADVWFLHDPQLLPLGRLIKQCQGATRIWTVHIDLTHPNPSVMDELLPLTAAYDTLICSLGQYVPSALPSNVGIHIAPPAIDPLTCKNAAMPGERAREIVAALGIDSARPLVTQVSRFDVWKDPWGVVDAYRLARVSHPGLQLALLGLSQANDDPEGADVLRSVREYADRDPDIHLFFNPAGLPASNDEIVNALQSHSDALLQKSTREGFGLTVSEGMWKGKPVIGGNVGGIRLQIEDEVSGFLVDSPEQAGERIAQLLGDPDMCAYIGRNAKDRVRDNFLLPRLLYDYMQAAHQAGTTA